MTHTYEKYGKKKPSDMKATEFIDLLNKKSIKDCVKLCEDSKLKKSSSSKQDMNDFKRSRDEETYGKRPIQVPKRPQQQDPGRGRNVNDMYGYSGDMGSAAFAPIDKNAGGFIRADGQMGDRMFFGDLEREMSGNRADSKDDLERLVNERRSSYSDRQQNKGFDGNNSMYNPNIFDERNDLSQFGNRQMPQQHIDFSIVKGRHKGNQDTNNVQNDYSQMMNYDNMDNNYMDFMQPNMMQPNMMQQQPNVQQLMQQIQQLQQQLQQQQGHQQMPKVDMDVESGYNNLLADRNKSINNQMPKGNFNPMMSPHMNNMQMNNFDVNQALNMQKLFDMQNNNHLNYNGGVASLNENNAMKNLDEEQLGAYIKKMKDKIYHQMNITNFDPLFLQTLDSKQLDALINKLSYDLSGLNNITIEKAEPSQKIDQLPEFFNDMVKVEDIPKQKVNENHKTKHTDMLIKVQDYTDQDNYSDYMVELNDELHNVISAQIINLNLPNFINYIGDNNKIEITFANGNEISTEINPGYYDFEQLISAVSDKLDGISISKDYNNKVVLSHPDQFTISNNDKSIFRQFGFLKNNYIGKKTYISENEPSFGKHQQLYMFIEGLDDHEPVAIFNTNDNLKEMLPINIHLKHQIDKLSEVFVKFKSTSDVLSSHFIDFKGLPHEILLRVTTN